MPKTDEQGVPCHDKRDNYCPVCGWDCEDKPAMTDPTISQDALVKELRFLADSRQQMGFDRAGAAMDAAADIIEAHLRTPATDTEAMRLLGEISTACEINQGFLPSDLLARIDAVLGDDVG